jgi:adenylate cyclase
VEKGLLGASDYYPSTGNAYDFEQNFLVLMGTATIMGLALGAFKVLYLNHRFDKSNLLVKVILKTLI